MLRFELLQPEYTFPGPRLGRLYVPDGELKTPLCVGMTSRGVIPHLSFDLVEAHTSIRILYMTMEDFIGNGRDTFALASAPNQPLLEIKRFTQTPQKTIVILAPRRAPPSHCPVANTDTGVAILSSVGFGSLSLEEYKHMARQTGPDILVGLGDVALIDSPGRKRRDRMCLRTEQWMRSVLENPPSRHGRSDPISMFAPVIPLEPEEQSSYLELLVANTSGGHILGLVFYKEFPLVELPSPLSYHCRLCLIEAKSPQEILAQISDGFDMFPASFAQQATEAGICLSFVFPQPKTDQVPEGALGYDMWHPEYATDTRPMLESCKCYSCQRHMRAYVQHLLNAKEMLAWTLLQIHNLQMMEEFFAAIRSSIAQGCFENHRQNFARYYTSELPTIRKI